jgi:hypothetical protein
MTNTQEHQTVEYRTKDFWRGTPNASDARIDEVEVSRIVRRYPITKDGKVQWTKEEKETTVLFRLPVGGLAPLVSELIETLSYHASGRVLDDLGFEPARAKKA